MLIVVCDIDGTISDPSHRVDRIPDWDAFHEGMADDPPIQPVIRALQAMMGTVGTYAEIFLIFLTGRPEKHRITTTDWILQKMDLHELDDYVLYMRGNDDYRPDVEYKGQWLTEMLLPGGGMELLTGIRVDEERMKNCAIFIEDRDRVVEMWRNRGMCCLQPMEGSY